VNAESVLEALSGASTTHQAESLGDGHAALKSFTDATRNNVAGSSSGGRTAGGGAGSANAFREPVMLFASPSGIALSTQKSAHVSADEHINFVSGQGTHIATGKSLIASVAGKLSLFVQNAGMKLFAGKGKVEVQAHSDNIELTAQKTMKLLSATEKIEAAAKQEILLTSGGAYIRIKGGNIEIHAPGKVDFKGSQHSFNGPASQAYPLPQFQPSYQAQYVLQNEADGTPMIQHAYELKLPSGRTLLGHTNDFGETVRVFTPSAQDVNLRAFKQDKIEVKPWKFAGGGQPDIRADYLDDADEA